MHWQNETINLFAGSQFSPTCASRCWTVQLFFLIAVNWLQIINFSMSTCISCIWTTTTVRISCIGDTITNNNVDYSAKSPPSVIFTASCRQSFNQSISQSINQSACPKSAICHHSWDSHFSLVTQSHLFTWLTPRTRCTLYRLALFFVTL